MTTERWTDEMLDKLAKMRSNQAILQQEQTETFANQAILQQEQTEMRREFKHTIGIVAGQ